VEPRLTILQPSSYRGVIRYSLCVLVVAFALASALDCGCELFLMVARRIFHYGYDYPGQFQAFYGAGPVFLLVAVVWVPRDDQEFAW
jgi:hypothetical protein